MMRTRSALLGMLVATFVWLASATTHAQNPEPYALHYDLRVDIPVTMVSIGLWLGSQELKGHLAPKKCRLCEPNRMDWAVRNAAVWNDTVPAHRASNWFAFAIVPIGSLATIAGMSARSGKPKNVWVDGLLIAESVGLAADLNQLVKFVAGRRRPFVHAQNPSVLADAPNPSDNNVSFYSGHTSLAFSVVAATGTVASLRGYRGAPYIWAVGAPLAAAAGYFRMGADRHYLTDVLTGAVMGSAVGVLVPWLFHNRKRTTPGRLGTGSSPLSLTYTWMH